MEAAKQGAKRQASQGFESLTACQKAGYPFGYPAFCISAEGIRIMSAHAGGMCMSQCEHWRIRLFLFVSHGNEKECKRIPYGVPRRRGLRIVRDGVFFFKANAVSHSLRRSSFQNQNRTVASCLADNFGTSLCWVLILYIRESRRTPDLKTLFYAIIAQYPIRYKYLNISNSSAILRSSK